MAKKKKSSAKKGSKSKEKDKVSEKSETKEKVCEIFEVGKKGEEKTKKVCDIVEKKQATKEEIEKEKKTLRNILIGLGLLVLLVLFGIYFINSLRHFEYRGVTGDVVKEGDLIFYKTAFPVKYQGQIIPYNIYIRNDPRKLNKIPFEGEMDFGVKFNDGNYRLVLDTNDEFNCDGDEVISIGNLVNLKALGIKVVKDENASCDSEGRYMYVKIQKSEKSEIKQIGNACYELNVANCEILKVTERFMIEAFVKYYQNK